MAIYPTIAGGFHTHNRCKRQEKAYFQAFQEDICTATVRLRIKILKNCHETFTVSRYYMFVRE
jgi:hypothetical protein